MATNLDIIKRALKKIHVLPAGTEPSAVEAAEGMTALQSMIVELIGQGSLGRLIDVLATSAYTARENDRIQASVGVTITLPTTITQDCNSVYPYLGGSWCSLGSDVGYWDYGSTFSGSARPPRDRTPVVVIQNNGDGTFTETDYVWSIYKGKWVQIQALTQQGDFPFATNLENGFAAMLGERLADDYDQAVGPETKLQAGRCRIALSTKPDSAALPTAACYF